MIDANVIVPTFHLAWLGYLVGFEVLAAIVAFCVCEKIGELSGLMAGLYTFSGFNVVGVAYLLFRYVLPRFVHFTW